MRLTGFEDSRAAGHLLVLPTSASDHWGVVYCSHEALKRRLGVHAVDNSGDVTIFV